MLKKKSDKSLKNSKHKKKYFNEKIKALNVGDLISIKLSIFFLTLWIVCILSDYFKLFIYERIWAWLALFIIFGIKPFWKLWFGTKSAEGIKK